MQRSSWVRVCECVPWVHMPLRVSSYIRCVKDTRQPAVHTGDAAPAQARLRAQAPGDMTWAPAASYVCARVATLCSDDEDEDEKSGRGRDGNRSAGGAGKRLRFEDLQVCTAGAEGVLSAHTCVLVHVCLCMCACVCMCVCVCARV